MLGSFGYGGCKKQGKSGGRNHGWLWGHPCIEIRISTSEGEGTQATARDSSDFRINGAEVRGAFKKKNQKGEKNRQIHKSGLRGKTEEGGEQDGTLVKQN